MVLDSPIEIGLNAVIVACDGQTPYVLTLPENPAALPAGPFAPARHRTFELGLRDWVTRQTGLALGHVEQLYTFGDRGRDPREQEGGSRHVSVGYLALARHRPVAGATWRDWYDFFPWEDWRDGQPALIPGEILPALEAWVRAAPVAEQAQRRTRLGINFGTARWDAEKVLERYELLYEAGLVAEAVRDRGRGRAPRRPGMALDHRRMLATAISRLRGKLKYRPVVFELLDRDFTLLQLQRVVEALAGVRLHKQNFRRLVEKGGLVEDAGAIETGTGGRPARKFRFRRQVLLERSAPGLGLPAASEGKPRKSG